MNALTPDREAWHVARHENAQAALRDVMADNARLREALEDILSGWRYIRKHHGDLPGVGWNRAEDAARAALAGLPQGADNA